MQIVIELSKEQYDALCMSGVVVLESQLPSFLKALRNGIVLPKGYGDLIDRDWVLKMKCTDLVDADGVTMYAVPTGNILRMIPVVPADKEG